MQTVEKLVSPPRMGRKPQNLALVHVRLSPDLLARIDKLVANYGRAGFIRNAVERAVSEAEGQPTPDEMRPAIEKALAELRAKPR